MGFLSNLAAAIGFGPREPDAKAHEMVQSGAILLDVRTPGEFAGGHLKGAMNIPVQELSMRVKELAKKKSKKVVIYCRSGARSATAARLLQPKGYEVYDLGPMGAWGANEDIVR